MIECAIYLLSLAVVCYAAFAGLVFALVIFSALYEAIGKVFR